MNPYLAWPKSAKVAIVLFTVIAGGFILIAAKTILIPIALAMLIAFSMHPLVKRLTRWGLNRIASVVLVVGTVSVCVAGLGYIASHQLKAFADELPLHEANIERKVLAVKSMFKGGTFERLSRMIEKINNKTDLTLQKDQSPSNPSAAPTAPDAPSFGSTTESPSAVANAGRSVSESLRGSASKTPPTAAPQPAVEPPAASSWSSSILTSPLVSSLIDVLATGGIVLLLVTFFLIQQADIRDRMVSVAGRGALATTTKALEEAGARISRYLLMLFIVNSTYGLAVAIGLWAMGVPYAIMWGLFAGLIRYVPYIGPWIGATMPIAVSLATSTGWSQPVMVVALFGVLELVSNNVMEPILYGHSVGLSELGVILAAIVWAWLWGPIGLVLATPMTVCFVVLGRYIPGLRIFDHLLGQRAEVTTAVRLYQRLLARDEEEAEDLVEDFLKDHSAVEAADELIVPAAGLIRHDLAHEQIDESEADRMTEILRHVVEAVIAEGELKPCSAGDADEPPLVVGIASHSEEEAILLELLNAVCRDVSCRIEVLSSGLLQSERLAAVIERSPELVIVSALPPGDLPHARQLCKRLKAANAARRIVVARWGHSKSVDRSPQLVAAGADDVVSTVAELEPMIKTAYHMRQASRPAAAPTPTTGREKAQAG
jgi:predicted PurR-regulated permease PerM